MELTLATRAVGAYYVVEIHGEIDVYTAPQLRECLTKMIEQGQQQLVVDLGRVDFLDSTGLGVLVGVKRRLHVGTGSLALVCPHERLLKIFRITGLDSVFRICDSVDAAIGATPN